MQQSCRLKVRCIARIERVRSLMIDRRARDVILVLLGNQVYCRFRELRKLQRKYLRVITILKSTLYITGMLHKIW